MIKIVTDSTAYLPETTIRGHDIQVVPLYVHFGEDAYREGVDLSNADFFAKLKDAAELPTTSQPSAGEFHEVFAPLVEAGHEILALTISTKLSGTWNSAKAAQAMLPGAAISVVDSLSTSVGLQLMVEAATQAVTDGASREEIVDQIEGIKARMNLLFVVDTLEYLAKGGRIGNARALLGTMLNVKPILYLQDGAIEPLEQVRSKRKAVARMLDLIEENVGTDGTNAKVGVMSALVPDEGHKVKQQLMDRLGCREPFVSDLGPVIGTHTGPGVIGVAAYT
jgi:DegV family protein with EDD domain